MVLDASTTKEESLAYNPQGGRIVLHTACDKEVATFAFGQEAQWRNGKDNRPHLYVEGNPVSYRDPSGNALSNSWLYAIGTYFIAKSQGMNDQQAMIYAASAYGVGRAKDRNKGDFWKHNDISRGITSAWKSYLKTDFGKLSTKVYNFARKSDIGVSITKNWQGTVQYFKEWTLERILVLVINISIIAFGILTGNPELVMIGIAGASSTLGVDGASSQEVEDEQD
jgi:hypothetical protein